MPRQKHLQKDEHGYINNRGKSKYWGVTTAVGENGKDYWVVSFTPVDSDVTYNLRSVDFKLTELDAARVAAYVYEKGSKIGNLGSDLILSANGRYVLFINRVYNKIYKRPFDSSKMAVYSTPSESLMDFFKKDEPKVVSVKVEKSKVVCDTAFNEFLNLIDLMKFTDQQILTVVSKLTSK